MAKQIRVEQTDLETGEVVQMVALKPTRGPHPFRREGFVQMSQAAMLELAQNPVSGEAMRVLMALCAVLDFENFIQLSQADLAKLIGMKRPHVNRAMAELFERGIVIKGMKVGRSLTYRLSPTFGFKTKGSNFTKLMADINEFARAGNGSMVEK
jgi:biotin operon repressor